MYTQQNFIYILIVLSSLLIYIFLRNRDKFTLQFHTPTAIKQKSDYKLECILSLREEDGFLASFKDTNNKAKNTLLKTTNLKGNHWKSVCNGQLPNGDRIHQLFWYETQDKDQANKIKLMCIGEKSNKYTFYIKEKDITSHWIPFKINNQTINNKMISFIIYDLNKNKKLLGINSQNNQIYKLDVTKAEWIGPINFSDKPKIKRIIYDLDKKMLGLDINNTIWKKDNIYWETSEWKKIKNNSHNYISNQNKYETKEILDLIHDTDGKLIAITKPSFENNTSNLIKQIDFSFNSLFSDYYDEVETDTKSNNSFNILDTMNINNKTLLTKSDIIMNKTGLDIETYDYIKKDNSFSTNKKQLIDKLNFLLQFKKKFVNKCKYNNNNTNFTHHNTDTYDEISNLIKSIESKGY